LNSLEKVANLPANNVLPGHGEPTTIDEEKYENPFVTIEE
jgi:glyoxylase-like metal-dependent hydrolase (beta-lactamase superfamily II)